MRRSRKERKGARRRGGESREGGNRNRKTKMRIRRRKHREEKKKTTYGCKNERAFFSVLLWGNSKRIEWIIGEKKTNQRVKIERKGRWNESERKRRYNRWLVVSIGWSVAVAAWWCREVNWSVHLLVGRLLSLSGWLIGWSVCCVRHVGQSASRFRPVGQSVPILNLQTRWIGNGKK